MFFQNLEHFKSQFWLSNKIGNIFARDSLDRANLLRQSVWQRRLDASDEVPDSEAKRNDKISFVFLRRGFDRKSR